MKFRMRFHGLCQKILILYTYYLQNLILLTSKSTVKTTHYKFTLKTLELIVDFTPVACYKLFECNAVN